MDAYVEKRVVRLLAGEIAARMFTRLPDHELSIHIRNPAGVHSRSLLEPIFREAEAQYPAHDVSKALGFTYHYRQPRSFDLPFIARQWWRWFWNQHRTTLTLLSEPSMQRAVAALADEYGAHLSRYPRGKEVSISGEMSFACLSRAGCLVERADTAPSVMTEAEAEAIYRYAPT